LKRKDESNTFDNFHRKLSARTPPSAFLFLKSQFQRAHKIPTTNKFGSQNNVIR